MLNEKFLEESCVICDNIYSLTEIEQLGWDGFGEKAHIPAISRLFKYFPNTRKWDKKEKRYRNFSYEALTNNTVFLQDAENFDDSFDCAIDLDWENFLLNRLRQYCGYFNVTYPQGNKIDDLLYHLSIRLYEYGSLENILTEIDKFSDPVQKLSIEVFVRGVFCGVTSNIELQPSIIKAIENEYNNFVNTFKQFKISCFSSSPSLNRMWSSKYADDNKGFCLEYEIDLTSSEKMTLFNNIFPVIYSQKRNDTLPMSGDCDKSPTKEFLWQMFFNGLLRKSLYWIDQKEWRLILHKDAIKENPIPFFKIKKVYLGNKMPRKERIKITKYCRAHEIEYVGLIRDRDSFNLKECKGDCYSCKK